MTDTELLAAIIRRFGMAKDVCKKTKTLPVGVVVLEESTRKYAFLPLCQISKERLGEILAEIGKGLIDNNVSEIKVDADKR